MRSKKRIGDRPTRPTRHDPAPLTPLKIDNFWRNLVKLQHTPFLKINNFSWNLVKLKRIHFLKMDNFRRKFVKICEIEAHSFFFENLQFWIFDKHSWKLVKLRLTSFFESWKFSTKISQNSLLVNLRRTPHSKTYNFRRKVVNICEIEAHSLFKNWQFPTKFRENRWNWGALLLWKLTISDEK